VPFTKKEAKTLRALKKQYGPEKGEEVFYRMVNKGDLGVASKKRHQRRRKKKK